MGISGCEWVDGILVGFFSRVGCGDGYEWVKCVGCWIRMDEVCVGDIVVGSGEIKVEWN